MNSIMYLPGSMKVKSNANPDEVSDYCYKEISEIKNMLQAHPRKVHGVVSSCLSKDRRVVGHTVSKNFDTMTWLYYILVLIATFITMEGVTWLTHRYVMHGFLWYLHKDHHQVKPGFFEKNDAFFVIFAVPSVLLILLRHIQ